MWPFNKKKKVNIWKTIKIEYLRCGVTQVDNGYMADGDAYIDDFWVPKWESQIRYYYAHHQVCLITGEKRIIERYELERLEEFEDKKYFEWEKYLEDMTREARETNNYNRF